MAGPSNDSEDMISGINITPMVDVVLVLLMIFMMAAPTLYHGGIKINIPKAKSGDKMDRITLKFMLSKDGKLALDKRAITLDQVAGFVKKALELDPNANALVTADRDLSHGKVMEFIDHIKEGGLKKFAIAVETPESKD
jgi:biopolymer transport protein ExbD